MLARIHKSMKDKDQGFTLIELLVVMIIMGILAAIAIPVFLNQRRKAVDSSVKSDLRSVADYEETWFVDNNAYTSTAANFTGNVKFSTGNIVAVGLGASGFCVRGENPNSSATGGTNYFWYDSVAGGLKSGAASAAPTGGACAAATTFTTVS